MDEQKWNRIKPSFPMALFALLFMVSAQAQVGRNAAITVDSTYPGYDSSVINDEVINAEGGTETSWASAESTTEPHWVELDFSTQRDINSATIQWAYNNNQGQYMTSQRVEVQVWDGSAYQTVALMTPARTETSTTVNFSPVATTRLRFYQPAGQGPASYDKVMWLTEVDFGVVSAITGDSTYPGYDTGAINDGVIDPGGGTSTTWASAESTTEPHWVEITFDERTFMGSVTIHWAYNHNKGQYMTPQRIEAYAGSYPLGTATPAGPEASTTIRFEPIVARSLRIYQPAGQGPASYNSVMWLTEIDIDRLYSPEASFTTDPQSGFEAGVAIGFTDTSTDIDGTVSYWEWQFGDGNVSTDQHPIHTYVQPGSYEVSLFVNDDQYLGSGSTRRVLHVGGTVVDSSYPGYSASVINDGVIDAEGGTSTTWASSESDVSPHIVDIHLGGEKTLDFSTIHWAYNDHQGMYMTSQEVQVQIWDGSTYQTVATMTPDTVETDTTVTFPPVTTTRLRFYQPALQGPISYNKVMWLTEIDYGLSP